MEHLVVAKANIVLLLDAHLNAGLGHCDLVHVEISRSCAERVRHRRQRIAHIEAWLVRGHGLDASRDGTPALKRLCLVVGNSVEPHAQPHGHSVRPTTLSLARTTGSAESLASAIQTGHGMKTRKVLVLVTLSRSTLG